MLTKLQKDLSEKSAILITNPYNLRYLTGIQSLTDKEREFMFLISNENAWLITAKMFREEAKESNIVKEGKAEIVLLPERSGFFEVIKKALPFSVQKLFVEEYDLKLLEYLRLKKLLFPVKIKHLKNRVYDLRLKKGLPEIKLLQKAQELTARILKESIEYLRDNFSKGVSERELSSFITSRILSYSGCDLSFPPIVAFSENSAVPHHVVSDKKIEEGVLLIDLGVRYKGYCGDLTRTFYIGEPTKKFVKIYEIVNSTLDKCIDKVRSRTHFFEVHKAAVEEFKKEGMHPYFLHGIGHGVGLEVHERPFVRGREFNEVLEKNSVVTIEPGLYFEGEFGVRVEEMVWVKKNTSIVFKVFPRKLEDIILKLKS